MESIALQPIFTAILKGENVAAAFALLFVLAIIALFRLNAGCNKDLLTQRKEFEGELKRLYDTRLELLERVVVALERNTVSLNHQADLIETRTAVLVESTEVIRGIATTQDGAIPPIMTRLDDIISLCHQFISIVRPPS